MDKVLKPCNPERYTPSSEPSRTYWVIGSVNPRAGLQQARRRNFLFHLESNPGLSAGARICIDCVYTYTLVCVFVFMYYVYMCMYVCMHAGMSVCVYVYAYWIMYAKC
jgi:hypothetical protein